MRPLGMWEAQWAPYDEASYQTVLSHVGPADVILDIGAGDLRLARQMARLARHVYAIEMQPHLLEPGSPLPRNLGVICADARSIPWPRKISLGVLLMRHCTHVGFYIARLRAADCQRLATNARWGLDVELVNLERRVGWDTVKIGWYACACGQTGFVSGPPEELTAVEMKRVNEVETCPACDCALVDKIGL